MLTIPSYPTPLLRVCRLCNAGLSNAQVMRLANVMQAHPIVEELDLSSIPASPQIRPPAAGPLEDPRTFWVAGVGVSLHSTGLDLNAVE